MLEIGKSKPKRKQRPAYPLPKSRVAVILALLFGNLLLSMDQPIWFTPPLTQLTLLLYLGTTVVLVYGIYRWLRAYSVHRVLYLLIVGCTLFTIYAGVAVNILLTERYMGCWRWILFGEYGPIGRAIIDGIPLVYVRIHGCPL